MDTQTSLAQLAPAMTSSSSSSTAAVTSTPSTAATSPDTPTVRRVHDIDNLEFPHHTVPPNSYHTLVEQMPDDTDRKRIVALWMCERVVREASLIMFDAGNEMDRLKAKDRFEEQPRQQLAAGQVPQVWHQILASGVRFQMHADALTALKAAYGVIRSREADLGWLRRSEEEQGGALNALVSAEGACKELLLNAVVQAMEAGPFGEDKKAHEGHVFELIKRIADDLAPSLTGAPPPYSARDDSSDQDQVMDGQDEQ